MHFSSSLVRFCCHTVLLSLPCISQQNEPLYHQPVEAQERRSLTHERGKEQDFLCFCVGCREKTSPNALLPHPLLKLFWHGRINHTNNHCWRCLPDATGCAFSRLLWNACKSLTWVLAEVSGQINETNFQEEVSERRLQQHYDSHQGKGF